jgi:UDP-N-acetylglucosamine--N-acetylmuramyl-(pentapeptide) pyrophosphoryl-undecaprenol N-acetylglucosamine transferase
MIMAGGTGGHVFPALAVAGQLRAQGREVRWIGTRNGIEARLVPEAGIDIDWLSVQGLRGKGRMTLLLAPFRLLQACWQALGILRRHRPVAVLGMGGFASGPGGLMARLLRIPLVIHEQNAIPGLTNRLLARIANRVFCAFPGARAQWPSAEVVGNPVRADIAALPDPARRYSGRQDEPLHLLVVGGSLGAQRLNRTLPAALARLEPEQRPLLRHQCGPKNEADCRAAYADAGVEAEILPFIEDMPAAYAWADLVICRAGALTVSEIAAAGVAALFVPYPHAVDDHQYANARYLADAGAAEIRRDEEFTAEWLAGWLATLPGREQLMQRALEARRQAVTDADRRVADALIEEALS